MMAPRQNIPRLPTEYVDRDFIPFEEAVATSGLSEEELRSEIALNQLEATETGIDGTSLLWLLSARFFKSLRAGLRDQGFTMEAEQEITNILADGFFLSSEKPSDSTFL